MQRGPKLEELTVETVYPNFGLLRPDRSRAVIFHHGHFVEPLYLLMSTLKTMIFPNRLMPQEIWDFEAENFAWIDFFWSLLGRSGEVGKGVGIIYEKFHDEQETDELLNNLAKGLADRCNLPVLGEGAEAQFFEKVFRIIVDQVRSLERQQNIKGDPPLSQDAQEGLEFYLRGPLTRQIRKECREPLPNNMTFVFGHTHKPFEKNMYFKGYPGWTDVYNSGGWVVDTPDPQPEHGGAVIFVDEDLNTASVRFYYESDNPENYRVTASGAKESKLRGPLYDRLSGLILHNKDLFRSFADVVAREVQVRAENIGERIKS